MEPLPYPESTHPESTHPESVLSLEAIITPLAPSPACRIDWLLEDLSRIPLAIANLSEVEWSFRNMEDSWIVGSLQTQDFIVSPLIGSEGYRKAFPGVVWSRTVILRSGSEGPSVSWPAWKIFPYWIFRYLGVPLSVEVDPESPQVAYEGLEQDVYGICYPRGVQSMTDDLLAIIETRQADEEARKERQATKSLEAHTKAMAEIKVILRKDPN